MIPELATKYGYFCYPGTEWGMTPDEVFKSLNLHKDDFEESIETNFPEGLSNIIYSGDGSGVGDLSSNLTFRFTRFAEGAEYALSSITVANSYQKGEKWADRVAEMVSKYNVPVEITYDEQIREQASKPFTLKLVTYKSASMEDLSADIQSSWTSIFPEGKAPELKESVLSEMIFQYIADDNKYRLDYQALPAAFLAFNDSME